jgi:hypothetical protein
LRGTNGVVTGVIEQHESQRIAAKLVGDKSRHSLKAAVALDFDEGMGGIPFIFLSPLLLSGIPMPLWGIIYGLIVGLLTLATMHRFPTGVPSTQKPFGNATSGVSTISIAVFGAALCLFSASL